MRRMKKANKKLNRCLKSEMHKKNEERVKEMKSNEKYMNRSSYKTED